MRHVLFLVLALVLGAMSSTSQAAYASIDGAWSGSGIARYQGRADRIVCRVNFTKIAQKSFRVSALCSTGNRRYEQVGRVTSVSRTRYRGYVYNPQFNERGNVSISQSGSRLTVSVSGGRGSANLTLSRR
jgi:hypothetical protein